MNADFIKALDEFVEAGKTQAKEKWGVPEEEAAEGMTWLKEVLIALAGCHEEVMAWRSSFPDYEYSYDTGVICKKQSTE